MWHKNLWKSILLTRCFLSLVSYLYLIYIQKHWVLRFVCTGGGGLISGIAVAAKDAKENVKVIGCQPKNGEVMWRSIQEGKITDLEYKEVITCNSY